MPVHLAFRFSRCFVHICFPFLSSLRLAHRDFSWRRFRLDKALPTISAGLWKTKMRCSFSSLLLFRCWIGQYGVTFWFSSRMNFHDEIPCSYRLGWERGILLISRLPVMPGFSRLSESVFFPNNSCAASSCFNAIIYHHLSELTYFRNARCLFGTSLARLTTKLFLTFRWPGLLWGLFAKRDGLNDTPLVRWLLTSVSLPSVIFRLIIMLRRYTLGKLWHTSKVRMNDSSLEPLFSGLHVSHPQSNTFIFWPSQDTV